MKVKTIKVDCYSIAIGLGIGLGATTQCEGTNAA